MKRDIIADQSVNLVIKQLGCAKLEISTHTSKVNYELSRHGTNTRRSF